MTPRMACGSEARARGIGSRTIVATVVWMLAASLRPMAQDAGVPTEIEAGAPTAIVGQTTARSALTLSVTSLAIGRQLSPPPPTPSVRPPRATISKRKAALIGAAIGAGGGAAVGVVYCRADCGGGPTRGALVFAPAGAAIGAAAGFVLALLPWP